MKKGKWDRLITCHTCDGDGAIYDPILDDLTIQCANCAGEGALCGVCLLDVEMCHGEGACWEDDPEAEWSQVEGKH